MQYVPGESLDKIIANGPASVQLGLSVGIQIADGLSAAHRLGIFHRDLKPGNVMLTDGGVVKILDFGLARRISTAEAEFDPAKPGRAKDVSKRKSRMTYTAHGGTIAYMAPEQFVTGQTSVQSDIFAVGVTLYELLSGRHPFVRPESEEFQSVRAIQFAEPQPLSECCPQVPPELASVIATCLQKTPSGRYSSAADLREALRTIMKTMQLETGILPGDTANNLQVPAAERAQRATGFLSMLAERFRESADVQKQNTILVLPFQNFGQSGESPLYGYALADAIAARLARMSSLVVRPSSSLMQLPVPMQQMDPLSVGKKLLVQWVLAGNFMRSEKGLRSELATAGCVRAERARGWHHQRAFLRPDRRADGNLQRGVRHAAGAGQAAAERRIDPQRADGGGVVGGVSAGARPAVVVYVAVRRAQRPGQGAGDVRKRGGARCASLLRDGAAWGLPNCNMCVTGFGGQMYLLAARRSFDRALEIDPGSIEANLYRVYMLLSRGEKESARHGIEHLLGTADNNWNVHLVAGQTLRLDGMYEEALQQFNRSLQLNPSNAPIIYNHRARVYQYQNQLELAEEELQKGLTLEPRHPLLRTSIAYQRMRQGDMQQAISILEAVIHDDESMRIAFPTLALCYVQVGERERAASLIEEDSLVCRGGGQRDGLSPGDLLCCGGG